MIGKPTLGFLARGGHPILKAVCEAGKRPDAVRIIAPGYYEIGHFSGDILLWGRNDYERSFFELGPEYGARCPDGYFCNYGVCDSPEQFIGKFGDLVAADARSILTTFTRVPKDPDIDWRWHKWGPYIGDGKPECEYLRDEKVFADGVCVYHMYDVS